MNIQIKFSLLWK